MSSSRAPRSYSSQGASSFQTISKEPLKAWQVGLQLTKPSRDSNQELARHPNFDEANPKTGSGKLISNKINKTGTLRTPTMCIACIAAIANWSEQHIPGRGAASFNEFCSCLVHDSYGNGGTQCGRCVGLGKGLECCSIPIQFAKPARNIIRQIPQYNRILTTSPGRAGSALEAADKEFIKSLAKQCLEFRKAYDGYLRNNDLSDSEVSSKRQKYTHNKGSVKSLTDLQTNLTHTRRDIEKLSDELQETREELAAMKNMLNDLMKIADVSRARSEYACAGIRVVGKQLDDFLRLLPSPLNMPAFAIKEVKAGAAREEVDNESDDE